MKLCPDEEESDSINLTPMIDVVFLLLIFFLTATTFQKEEVEMSLDLPDAASGEPGEERKVIVINVASDGRVLVDGRQVSVMALRQKLKAAATRDKDQEILIRGDEKAQFGLVAQVFDACLLAKLHSISIGADPVGDNPR
jgi:biopolymer transport protein ExbD